MQSMSEHTKSSNMKHVKMSVAVKKASIQSFNEHLENVTKEANPTYASVIYEDINEMPSNRQGETDITAAQMPIASLTN